MAAALASTPGTWFVSLQPPRPPAAGSADPPLSGPGDVCQLHYLADVPHFTHNVAKSQWDEWADIYQECSGIPTLEAATEWIAQHYSHRNKLGMCVVATIDGEYAGTGCLSAEDAMPGHPYYGIKPWITCMVVEPKFRKRGIAALIFNRLSGLAQRWGFTHIWLITEDAHTLYARHGWKELETMAWWHNKTFTLMRRDFDRAPALPADEYATLKAQWAQDDAKKALEDAAKAAAEKAAKAEKDATVAASASS